MLVHISCYSNPILIAMLNIAFALPFPDSTPETILLNPS